MTVMKCSGAVGLPRWSSQVPSLHPGGGEDCTIPALSDSLAASIALDSVFPQALVAAGCFPQALAVGGLMSH